jgi:hypothetical protein
VLVALHTFAADVCPVAAAQRRPPDAWAVGREADNPKGCFTRTFFGLKRAPPVDDSDVS